MMNISVMMAEILNHLGHLSQNQRRIRQPKAQIRQRWMLLKPAPEVSEA